MKEFIEKLIGRLEEEVKSTREMQTIQCKGNDGYGTPIQAKLSGEICALLKAKNIVNQLAEEREQTIDVAELVEKFGQKNIVNDGWIPCIERLPKENEPVDTVCEVVNVMLKSGTVTSGWCNRYLERWYVLDEHCDYPLQKNYEDVIAWQPLPAPYQPKGE